MISHSNSNDDIFVFLKRWVRFDRPRGRGVDSPHKWGKYWRTLEWAAEIYGPEKFGVHLICGMGETEQEII